MIWENLRDVVLVGTLLRRCRRTPRRRPDCRTGCRSLIYLDAFVPENGKTLFDYLPDNGEGRPETWRWPHGDGWRVPPEAASFFAGQCGRRLLGGQSVHDATRCPVLRRQRRSAAPATTIANIGYIRASGFDGPFGQFYAKAGERRWWREERCMRA